jgi:hypothetical protein
MGHTKNSAQTQFVPVLVPGASYVFENEVLNVDPVGRAGSVYIHLKAPDTQHQQQQKQVSGPGPSVPIISANVLMPASEMFDVDGGEPGA